MGVGPIPHSEILAYSRLTRTRFQVWELDVLDNLDVLFRNNTRRKEMPDG